MTPNPYAWIHPGVFAEFAQDVGLDLNCQRCRSTPKGYYCDTGFDDGYIVRSTSYTNTDQGLVNMLESRHIPCVRVTCVHCGHIELFGIYQVMQWHQKKQSHQGGLADLFSPEGPA